MDDRTLDLEPLPSLVGYALRRAHASVFARFQRSFVEIDIRPVQVGILTVVDNNPGLKQSEVCAVLGIKRANLVPLLDGLAARHLIQRTKVAEDRRSHALVITPQGKTLLEECRRREAALEGEIAAIIGEEGRRELLALLVKLEPVDAREGAESD